VHKLVTTDNAFIDARLNYETTLHYIRWETVSFSSSSVLHPANR